MSSTSPYWIENSGTFKMPVNGFVLLKDWLRSFDFEFLGDDFVFYGDVVKIGVPRSREIYNTIPEFIAKAENPQDAVNVQISSRDYEQTITLNIETVEQNLRIYIKGSGEQSDTSKERFQTIVNALQLTTQPSKLQQGTSVRFNAVYSRKKFLSSDSIIQFMNENPAKPTGGFYATYMLFSKPQYRYEVNDVVLFKDKVAALWEDISKISFNLDYDETNLHVDFDFDRKELVLNFKAGTTETVDKVVRILENKLELDASRDPYLPRQFNGTKKEYFTKEEISPDWMIGALAMIGAMNSMQSYFSGQLFFLRNQPNNLFYGKQDTFEKAIQEHWKNLRSVSCSVSGNECYLYFDCDVNRELISFEIKAATADFVDRIFMNVENKLGLDKVEGVPYRYRRFAKTYEIINWTSNRDFAEAIQEAIKIGFPVKYVVHNAYAEEDKGSAALQPLFDVPGFVEWVKDNSRKFSLVQISLEGPREAAFGISADLKKMQLAIRGSFTRSIFNQLTGVFEDKLDLKLLKEVKNPDSPQKSAKGESPIIKIVIAVLAFIASAAIINEAVPKYELQLTRPLQLEDKKPVEKKSDEIYIDWVVKKKQWWHTSQSANNKVDIQIFNDEQIPVRTIADTSPPVKIKLDPGLYDIQVVSDLATERPHVQVLLFLPSKDTTNKIQGAVPARK